jgi:hypothetical protein
MLCQSEIYDKPCAYNKSAVLRSAQYGLERLDHGHKKLLIVVSHSKFLRLAVSGAQYANADYCIFEFEHGNTTLMHLH